MSDHHEGMKRKVNDEWFRCLPPEKRQTIIDKAAAEAPQSELVSAKKRVQRRDESIGTIVMEDSHAERNKG